MSVDGINHKMQKKGESESDQADATVGESISAASSLTKKVHGKVRIFEETKKPCVCCSSKSRS
jgi:hypothetical protein